MPTESRPHRFGPFTLDAADRTLARDGRPLAVRARAFDLLVMLVEAGGRLVTKDEILDRVWAGVEVTDNNLQVQVSALRRLLGNGWITTVPGRGYRFAPDGSGEAPVSRPAAAALPEPAGELVGREAELRAAEAALETARVLTLTGPGGIGKTRLARELVRRRAGSGGDAAWIDLARVADATLVAEWCIASLGLAPPAGGGTPDALAKHLGARAMLLVLDNAEGVLEAVAALAATLVERAPGVRLLVTSQAPLRVAGEQVVRLEPLALPEPGADAESAARSPAVALFVARARSQVAGFTLDAGNAGAVVAACRSLDGMPLALELAAGSLPRLGIEPLARMLGHRFEVLTAGSRDAPPRHRSLAAVFEWSHGLLAPEEQVVFRRLGLLGPHFTLDEAVEVASDDALDPWTVIETLGQLVDRSLVVSDGADAPSYTLLESGRAYARARVDERADAPAIARALRLHEDAGRAAAARSGVLESLQAYSAALELVPLIPPGEGRDARELESCLALGPVLQATVGPAHPRAEAVYRRAHALAAGRPADASGFKAAWGLWHFLAMAGRDRAAAPFADEIVALAAMLGDDLYVLEASHAAMSTQQLLGHAPRAVEAAERVLARYDRDRHHEPSLDFGGHDAGVCALGQGAVALWLTGREHEAAERARSALALAATMEHPYSRAVAGFYACLTWWAMGRRDELARTATDLHALCEPHGMDMLLNEARLFRGRARYEAGDPAGLADMERALDTIDAGGDFAFAIAYAAMLVDALLGAGRLDEAERRLERARAYSREGQAFFLPELLRLRAAWHERRGDRDSARASLAHAVSMAATQGTTMLERRAAADAERLGAAHR